jgi:hypothetical protein
VAAVAGGSLPLGMTATVSFQNLAVAARNLLLDRAAGVAIERLRSEGIESILLKGAAIAMWLYKGEVRPYLDIDLLVSPAQFDAATRALSSLGYVHTLEGADASEIGPKERELIGPDGVCIDLHMGFVGVPGDPLRCWEILSQRTRDFTLAGRRTQVKVLDIPARTMHLALHAAQNGVIDVKAVADLQRGLEQVDREQWRSAAGLAEELGATEAFAAGLRLVPAGRSLADELSLPKRISVELLLRTRSAPQQAIFFERVREADGARQKLRLVGRKLFPTVAYMRVNVPLARRGRIGLLVAWAGHPWLVVRGTAPALLAWLRARSATRDAETR